MLSIGYKIDNKIYSIFHEVTYLKIDTVFKTFNCKFDDSWEYFNIYVDEDVFHAYFSTYRFLFFVKHIIIHNGK
jgi:hypothetical protein